jgi:hypothetical protein
MKYPRSILRPSAILVSLALIFTVSCQLDVPMKEMVTAKTSIESAKAVDAEKYSPEELKKAEELLLQSHALLSEKKDKEAKKAAEDSITAALAAENKALPSYADAHIEAAEAEYQEADKAFAERFSPEKFAKAGTLTTEAKQNFENRDFRKSADLADQALAMSVEAKNEALMNSSVIQNQINTLETKYNNLKKDKFSSSANENLTKAGTALTAARTGLANKDFKSTMAEIRNAEIELDAANLIITKKGMYAKIEKLRGDLNSSAKEAASGDVKSDLDKALLALNAAETSLEQNYIEDADMRIKEAETLIGGANAKMKEKNALAAIAKAEKLLAQAREKDSANAHSENLGKAGKLIDNGRTSIKNKKYNEGISNAEEAETLIAAVLNSLSSEAAEAKLKASADEQKEEVSKEDSSTEKTEITEEVKPAGNVYTVQWRKKNTDCLWRIAQKVYKDAAYWPAIYIANRDQIKDPDLIFPGQKFVIPPKPQKRPSYKELVEEEKTKEMEKEKAVGEDKPADKDSRDTSENK